MNDQQDAPVAIPWYKSAVLRGILIAVLTQVLDKVQIRYHMNLSVFGLNAQDVADWAMDAITAAAVGYAAHGRVTKPSPVVTLTKAKADTINVQPPPPAPPAPEEVRK
jgi:hypothetical protein